MSGRGEKGILGFTQAIVSQWSHHGWCLRKNPRDHWKMWSVGFVLNYYCPINYPNIHQFHRVSCFKVALGSRKACCCFHHSVHLPPHTWMLFFEYYWVRLANQTKLFCSNEILHLKTSLGNCPFWRSLALIIIGWTHTSTVGCSKIVVKTCHCNYRKLWIFLRGKVLMD